jgi:hypothetical protein
MGQIPPGRRIPTHRASPPRPQSPRRCITVVLTVSHRTGPPRRVVGLCQAVVNGGLAATSPEAPGRAGGPGRSFPRPGPSPPRHGHAGPPQNEPEPPGPHPAALCPQRGRYGAGGPLIDRARLRWSDARRRRCRRQGEGRGMPIDVACGCGSSGQVPKKHAGKRGRCPRCKAPMVVPGWRGWAGVRWGCSWGSWAFTIGLPTMGTYRAYRATAQATPQLGCGCADCNEHPASRSPKSSTPALLAL